MKTILETSPITLVNSVVKAIKDGYYVTNTNAGWITATPNLYEICLSEQKDDLPIDESLQSLDKVFIQDYDAQKFLNEVQKYVVNGFEVEEGSIYWDTIGTKYCTMINPAHPFNNTYTREQLEEMDWETEFKAICKVYGVKGRQRTTMINLVLNKQEERNEA